MSKIFKNEIIPYARQIIGRNDIAKVIQTLKSDFLTQGPEIEKFEKKICNYTGAKYSVAVNSATSGLHLACLALELKPGDCLWTSPNSFVASSNCGLYCGAKIDFVDIDENSFNICPNKLEQKLKNTLSKNRPRILVVVHFGGNPCELEQIKKLSRIYSFFIIEDASHAIGSKYKSTKIGDCKFSDLVVFSFHPVKIITTGEGGMILTNKKKYCKKLKLLRNHGIFKDIQKFHKKKNFSWFYNQTILGLNYRMSDIEAALGSSQMTNINKWVDKRNIIARNYIKHLKNLPIIFQKVNSCNLSSYHLFVIKIDSKIKKFNRNKLYLKLKSQGINANVHYIPIYRHAYYQKLGFEKNHYKTCENYFKNCLTLPIFPTLKNKDINKIIKNVRSFFI
jgi:UDP-4-amino-4,6-dideoxy-N-acetyl-beta-L-altrosamine transaminase